MPEMKKKRLERIIQFLLVLVASLISTPGKYIPFGVRVRSEVFSVLIPLSGCSSSFCCLRAARDLKVGRTMFS